METESRSKAIDAAIAERRAKVFADPRMQVLLAAARQRFAEKRDELYAEAKG